MRQVYQDAKRAVVEVIEVPEPALGAMQVRVRNRCSAVSPGTERSTVAAAKDSYFKTARKRPDLVRQVMDVVRREGVMAAYRKVQTKLGEPKALGYSSAGVVEAVGPGAEGLFQVGDRVACAGQGHASHAEVVAVPVALCAKIPDGVGFDEASFTTIGAIALHGVRQADPTLGERVAVIGLGLVGQLTVQILRANGCRVAAYDLDADSVARARGFGAEVAAAGKGDDQVLSALAWTEGVGVDAVIVTAGANDESIMLAAAGMARERGRVVVVGAVPFGMPREIAYMKELDLRISRSYGPGRYDPDFEEKGVDWPIGYVRWTETRNLEAFLALLGGGQVKVSPMITHRFPIGDASKAYDELMGKSRPVGMVIDYPAPTGGGKPRAAVAPVAPAPVRGTVGVAFVGAGNFARGTLIPALKGGDGVLMRRVCTAHGLSAVDAAKKFGFATHGTDFDEVLADPSVNLVVIATRHDAHADLAARALASGRHVFVEKPLALDEASLAKVVAAAEKGPGALMVGFNRRFAPMSVAARDAVAGLGPVMVDIRVNAGALKAGHWANDPAVGGGRMIGEGCHFVDLASFLVGDAPIASISARSVGRARLMPEDFAVQIGFEDGSVAQIAYLSRGHAGLGKERVEVHAGGVSAVIDDFREAKVFRGGEPQVITSGAKGHQAEMVALIAALRAGRPSPTPLAVLDRVTRATFEVHRALSV